MKAVEAVLVTKRKRQLAVLSFDDATGDSELVLVIDGVAKAPGDLSAGAYLIVDDPEVADLAVLAGYATEPPGTRKRRVYRKVGRFYATGLLAGVAASLYWLVRALLELDVIRAAAWLALAIFLGFLGILWWFGGEAVGLGEEAEARQRYRSSWWAAIKAARGPKRRSR